jgi:16S rRNA (cytosine967-C5)-methyltransferase
MSSAPETHASPLPQNAVPVRLVAIDVFDQIIDGAQTLDRIFADHPGFIALNTLDRALVRMMVTTTIRRLGQIDDLLKMALNRDTPPEPAVLLSLLRLSVAQLLFMSMPDHAAVHVAVDVAGALGLERQKGLVNAVLRRLGREGREHTTRQDLPRLLTPPWMLKDWSKNFGVRAAHAAATALINEAPLDITVKDQGHHCPLGHATKCDAPIVWHPAHR